jgi:hypothetical protein
VTGADAVRAFMRERGLADELVAEGSEGLVGRWEQAARDAEHERYPFGIEDWLNELDVRQLLRDLLKAVPAALGPALTARLAEADTRVQAATEVAGTCLWGEALAGRMGWRPSSEWWYWRRPRSVDQDFDSG